MIRGGIGGGYGQDRAGVVHFLREEHRGSEGDFTRTSIRVVPSSQKHGTRASRFPPPPQWRTSRNQNEGTRPGLSKEVQDQVTLSGLDFFGNLIWNSSPGA